MSNFSRYYKAMVFVIFTFLCITLIPAFFYNLETQNVENLIAIGIAFFGFPAIFMIVHCSFNHYCDTIHIVEEQAHFSLLNGKEFVVPVKDVKSITCGRDRYIFDLPTKKINFLKRPFLFGEPAELPDLYHFYNATIHKE